MSGIPDFSDSGVWIIQSTLNERYDSVPATCREIGDYPFVAARAGDNRCQPFYSAHPMYGRGRESCDDLSECMVTRLQVQADQHAKEHATND